MDGLYIAKGRQHNYSGRPVHTFYALKYINNQHGLVLDIDDDNIMAEVTGYPGELDEFLEYVKSIGIVELSRTGITALEKGRLKL